MITAQAFRNEHLGKAIDVDGAYGAQCVDLFKRCCYLAGKDTFSLGGSGYADEIVHRFDALGLGSYFDLVQLSHVQYGDWIVWDKNSAEATNSHVAMFVGWDGSSRVLVFGQNQFGKSVANEGSISTSGVIGVLRLKAWIIPTSKPVRPSVSITDVAQAVLRGDYGNGDARRLALADAGYDYDTVQAEVNRLAGYDTPSAPTLDLDAIAHAVIRGDYGNGAQRRQALTDAGYDPDAVQNRVNELY